MARRKVRTLRHWKQQFDKNAKFIWRRPCRWGSKMCEVGDLVPEELLQNKGKLRSFWEAKRIELAEFEEAPKVKTAEPSRGSSTTEPEINELGGGWYEVVVDDEKHKVQGQKALDELLGLLGTDDG